MKGALTWFFLSLLFIAPSLAQKKDLAIIDSLVRSLPAMMRSDEARAHKMIDELEHLSKINGHVHGLVNVSFNRAWLSYRKQPADSAIRKIDSALKHIPGIQEDTILAKFYILRGQSYVKKTEMDNAMGDFNKAMQIAEKRNDHETKTGVLISVGWAFMETSRFKEAIGFFNEALRLNPSPDFSHRAVLLCNIAACHNTTGNFRAAEEFAQSAIAAARRTNNNIDLANGLQILARSHYQQGRLEEAIRIQKEASELRKLVSDPAMLAADYLQLADMYIKNNQPQLAIKFGKEAEALSHSHSNILKLSDAFGILASAYEAAGDYENAYHYQTRLLNQKDSLAFENYNQALAQMQVKYETAKQAAENLLLKQENLQSRLTNVSQQRWLIILGAVLLLIIASAIYSAKLFKGRYATRLAREQLRAQEMRAMAIMEAEEKERRRIAADLHDGIGQTIAAASMHINKTIRGENSLEQAEAFINQAGREVRALSHQVTPDLLLHHGIETAMEKAINQLNEANDQVRFRLFAHKEAEMNDMAALTLYRCFQELSTNIIKHSNAQNVNVSLNLTGDEQQMIVEDDGKGFDTSSVNKGLGLHNLENRVKLFGGSMVIDSTPGKGTTTIITLSNAT